MEHLTDLVDRFGNDYCETRDYQRGTAEVHFSTGDDKYGNGPYTVDLAEIDPSYRREKLQERLTEVIEFGIARLGPEETERRINEYLRNREALERLKIQFDQDGGISVVFNGGRYSGGGIAILDDLVKAGVCTSHDDARRLIDQAIKSARG